MRPKGLLGLPSEYTARRLLAAIDKVGTSVAALLPTRLSLVRPEDDAGCGDRHCRRAVGGGARAIFMRRGFNETTCRHQQIGEVAPCRWIKI
jgi:hypothetical protein